MASRPTERSSVLALVHTSQTTATAINSAGVLGRNFHQIKATVGNASGSAEAVTVKLLKQKGAGAGDTDSTLIQSASLDSNAQVVLNYDVSQTNTTEPYVAISVVPADSNATATNVFGLVEGCEPRFAPASDFDAATITVVNV
jgi:hypothetical protein